jgi:hypothetical protein
MKKVKPDGDRPSDWNLTIFELVEEISNGKRPFKEQELVWARDYDLSLIPEGVRIPKLGDVYESLVDQEVAFMTGWIAPVTGGGKGMLLVGERMRISADPVDEKPIGICARPLEYEKLEARMVSKEDRTNPKYGGFSLLVKTVDLIKNFKLVENEDSRPGKTD